MMIMVIVMMVMIIMVMMTNDDFFLKKHMTPPHSQMESDKEQIMVVSFPEKFSRNDEGGEGSISKKLSTF